MANWGYALAQGVAAGAKSASGMLDDQMKAEAKAAADDRAGDRQLDMQLRLEAARESMRERAEERKLATNRAQGKAITDRAKGMLEEGEKSVMDKVNTDPNAAPMTPEEIASMPPETRKLYELPDKGELADLKREAKAAMEMGDTVRAREINDRIRDAERGEYEKSRNATADKRADAELEYRKGMLDRADAREARAGDKANRVQVIDKDGNLRTVTHEQLNDPESGFRPVSAGNKPNADRAEAAKLRSEIVKLQGQKTKALTKTDKAEVQKQIDNMQARIAILQGEDETSTTPAPSRSLDDWMTGKVGR